MDKSSLGKVFSPCLISVDEIGIHFTFKTRQEAEECYEEGLEDNRSVSIDGTTVTDLFDRSKSLKQ